MSKDTIYREDAINVVRHSSMEFVDADTRQKLIEAIPSADRPQGEWIDKGWKGDWQFETDGRGNCWHEYECSECGFHNKGDKSNYCPNCLARMKRADDERVL